MTEWTGTGLCARDEVVHLDESVSSGIVASSLLADGMHAVLMQLLRDRIVDQLPRDTRSIR